MGDLWRGCKPRPFKASLSRSLAGEGKVNEPPNSDLGSNLSRAERYLTGEAIPNFRGAMHRLQLLSGRYRGSGPVMPPRILIVDDSALVRNLARKCFESEPGWQVCGEAGNGKEAIERAQELHPDVIVLDLSMPVMNGLEAARILSQQMPTVPLVMFTSFSTPNLEKEALAAGVSRVVLKSNPLAELTSCIRSVLVKDAA